MKIDSGLTLAAALFRRTSSAVGSGGRKRGPSTTPGDSGREERARMISAPRATRLRQWQAFWL